jgi:tRNA dimethylallyltransferase
MIKYKKPIIVIAGPTASGKSSLALKLAKDINGYIINADSRQIYKELKVGTAQPIPDHIDKDIWYIQNIKHYLYGQISIKEKYNIFQYQNDVQNVLNQEEDIPILVGGTGLYIDCIVQNYDLKNSANTTNYRRRELEQMNVKELQDLINQNDLKELNNSDKNNPIRLIRAIERGGTNHKKGEVLNYLYLFLDRNSNILKSKIENRIDKMFENGLLEENKALLKKGFGYSLPAMHSIGYQEFEGYFKGDKNLKQVKKDIILHTLQYVKRQNIWFKKNLDSIKVQNYNQVYDEARKFLSIS